MRDAMRCLLGEYRAGTCDGLGCLSHSGLKNGMVLSTGARISRLPGVEPQQERGWHDKGVTKHSKPFHLSRVEQPWRSQPTASQCYPLAAVVSSRVNRASVSNGFASHPSAPISRAIWGTSLLADIRITGMW